MTARVPSRMAVLSRLNPVPALPAYTGPYGVGTQDVEIPISQLSTSVPALDPSISTVNFRLFYPCQREQRRRARPVYWLPEPQGEYWRAYARFLQASPWLASLLRYGNLARRGSAGSQAHHILAAYPSSDSSVTPQFLSSETLDLSHPQPRLMEDGQS